VDERPVLPAERVSRVRIDVDGDDVLGTGAAEVELVRPGRLRVRRDDGTAAEVDDVDGLLGAWLRRVGATRVAVRPDRIVRSAG
jgi:3-(3-hydroxy-phenyl)propionate hydroxylase